MEKPQPLRHNANKLRIIIPCWDKPVLPLSLYPKARHCLQPTAPQLRSLLFYDSEQVLDRQRTKKPLGPGLQALEPSFQSMPASPHMRLHFSASRAVPQSFPRAQQLAQLVEQGHLNLRVRCLLLDARCSVVAHVCSATGHSHLGKRNTGRLSALILCHC